MGNCLSANAAVEVQPQRTKSPKEGSSSPTHPIQNENVQPKPSTEQPVNHAEAEPTATETATSLSDENAAPQRGYSSGASTNDFLATSSSDSNSEAEEDHTTDDSRADLDPLHLISMRNVMHANGDLTQSVVRIETAFGQPIEAVYEGVHDGPYLGEGVAGVVRMVKHRTTGVQYACKVLDIGPIQTEAGLRQLRDEISIMCQLDHPNIVRIEEVYESTNTIYLLQELCLGGDLFDRLDDQSDLHYTEAKCARLVKQMLSAVRYLHGKGIIHRDLKLENFLFSSSDCDSELKMIDFGLSKHFDLGEKRQLTEAVGTPYTCAPEVIQGSYDEKADIWAVGVIAYLLLSGDTPFGGCYENECLADVRRNILSGSFTFEPEDIWAHVSDAGKAFVSRLLNVDPNQRPTAKEVQRDEWLQVYARKPSCEGNRLSPKIVDALVTFKEYSEMRRLLHEVLSFTLLPEQIVELREEFEKMDADGDGEISMSAMKQVLMQNAGVGALGGLTEEEVEDIFNALRVNKNDSTIRYHEFLAATTSQCHVDDRNLRLAFDRLDSDRKGYISFKDLTDLLGNAPETLESLKSMWAESMYQCSCKENRITYDDFLVLMKGQTRRDSHRPSLVWSPQPAVKQTNKDLLDYATAVELKLPLLVGHIPSAGDTSHRRIPSLIPEEEDAEDESSRQREQRKTPYHRKRSKSFDDLAFDSGRQRRLSFPPRVRPSAKGDMIELIATDARAPLLATREEYKRHRDFRIAIYQVSKEFEARRNSEPMVDASALQGAGLIMKRGSMAPPELESEHQRMLIDAAVRRGGRNATAKRNRSGRRKKTQSDITGMMLSSQRNGTS